MTLTLDQLTLENQKLLIDLAKKLEVHVNEFSSHKIIEEKQLASITLAVVGDGTDQHPGFHLRLDRLEQKEKNRQKHLGYIYTSIVTLSTAVISLLLKSSWFLKLF